MRKNNLIITCQPTCNEKKEKPPLPQYPQNNTHHTKFNIQIIKQQNKRPHSNQFFSFGKLSHKVFIITKDDTNNNQNQNVSYNPTLIQSPNMRTSSSALHHRDLSSDDSLIFPQDAPSLQKQCASTSLIMPNTHHKTIFKIYKIPKNNDK